VQGPTSRCPVAPGHSPHNDKARHAPRRTGGRGGRLMGKGLGVYIWATAIPLQTVYQKAKIGKRRCQHGRRKAEGGRRKAVKSKAPTANANAKTAAQCHHTASTEGTSAAAKTAVRATARTQNGRRTRPPGDKCRWKAGRTAILRSFICSPRARFDFPNAFPHMYSPRLGKGRRAFACSSSCSNRLLPLPAVQEHQRLLTIL
jgi:hypothetical protein